MQLKERWNAESTIKISIEETANKIGTAIREDMQIIENSPIVNKSEIEVEKDERINFTEDRLDSDRRLLHLLSPFLPLCKR